jgi:hypothetical protein
MWRIGFMVSAGPGQEPVADFCEHGNEVFVSLKKAGYCFKLSDYQLFKKFLYHGVRK